MMKYALRRLMSMPKIYAEIAVKSASFIEIVGAWLLSHLLPQKLLWWEACSVSIVSRWVGANFTLTMGAK